MLDFVQWLQATDFFTYLRSSTYTYPVLLALHLAGIAMFGGMVMLCDLRLLGVAMPNRSVSDLLDQLRVPKRIGLVLIAGCGILLAGSKAEEYYYNAFFRAKLILLLLVALHSVVYQKSVYRNTQALDREAELPDQVKLAALLSLFLWIGLVIAGRGIGYIEPPLDKLHAQAHQVLQANARTLVQQERSE
jgi:uncharacterized membrane protein